MNGGALNFTLDATDASLASTVDKANASMVRLKITVQDINRAFEQTAVKADKALSAGDVKGKARALGGMASSVAYTAGMFAGPQVQSILYPALFASKELKGLAASMKLMGISAGMAAGTLGLAVGATYALTKAWDAYNQMKEAEKIEAESRETLKIAFERQKKSMMSAIDMAGIQELAPDHTIEYLKDLLGGMDNPRDPQGILKFVREQLQGIGFKPEADSQSQQNYWRMRQKVEAEAMGGDAEKRQEIFQNASDEIVKAFSLSQAAGMPFGPLQTAILSARDSQLAALDKTGISKTPRAFQSDFTSLEKMGGVIRGLGRGFGNDDARETANNTRRTSTLLETTNKELKNIGQKVSFANQ